MSVSSSTNINVTNVDVFINTASSAAQQLGLAPFPAGTSVEAATQQLEQALMKKLTADFGTQFPGVEIAGTDYGYAGPLSALNNGNVPQPVIDQVQNDLSNWDLPLTTDTPTRIAKTIVTELVDQAGVAGEQQGTVQINSNQSLNWMIGYAVVSVSQEDEGILYLFAAGQVV